MFFFIRLFICLWAILLTACATAPGNPARGVALVTIVGLGQSPTGDCAGLRPQLDTYAARGVCVYVYSYTDSREPVELLSASRVVVVAHSLGASRISSLASFMADHHQRMDVCLLDPVGGPQIRPANVDRAISFVSGWGVPMPDASMAIVKVGHNEITRHPAVAEWLRQAIERNPQIRTENLPTAEFIQK
jgi:hypothetical protein